MQILSIEDNLHELSNQSSWENMKIISICLQLIILPRVLSIMHHPFKSSLTHDSTIHSRLSRE